MGDDFMMLRSEAEEESGASARHRLWHRDVTAEGAEPERDRALHAPILGQVMRPLTSLLPSAFCQQHPLTFIL